MPRPKLWITSPGRTERVGHPRQIPAMPTRREIRGIELRYVLTFYLSQNGQATIPDLLEALDYYNFGIVGNPSKTVSDALRWEVARGRVRRRRRGLYGPGAMPRSTEDRIRKRAISLRAEADAMSGRNWDAFWNDLPD